MRRSAPALIAPFALLAALAGCAAAPSGEVDADAEGRDCFNVRSINGFNYVDRDTVRVSVSPRRSYDLDTFGATCFNLRWAKAIAVRSRPSSFLCVGDGVSVDARIITDQGDSCLVEAIRRAPEPGAEEDMSDDDAPEDAMEDGGGEAT